ncbi:hypothetical protein Desor_3653 [Desulfosporosinus orientis DSM 765]|uniref:Uncharacterized protein n=1 Tax=Desulfosporosinus orientis (strain ATCC 19365 / DSM 765 / NCIMB 8382 / VKM B-1628 / Singapore I) TaxID=768706 RepID=G7WIQ7_DESOD|nr:hypothetical protein [Desulfosporosinus orientis]AET69131.1 hypothetical protein Desor_3653 [Desulfosporosinus orientis DSM 765]
MIDKDIPIINRKGADYPLTSVVVLNKGHDGVVQANPVAFVHLIGGTSYSVKCNHKNLKSVGMKPPQRIEEASCTEAVIKDSIIKRFVRVISILLTVGGALFIVKHKRLMSFTKT